MLTLLLTGMIMLAYNYPLVYAQYPFTYVQNSLWEKDVIALVNGSRAYNYDLEMEQIALRHYAFRSGGSAGANETANWIKEQFEGFGLEAWLEPFEFTTWNLSGKPSLAIDDDGSLSTTYDRVSMQTFGSTHLSWPTPEGGVFADLVVLPLPEAANRSEIGLRPLDETAWRVNTTEKIVLIGKEVRSFPSRWLGAFNDKLSAQPPAALIFTWWYDWMAFTPPILYSFEGKLYWDKQIPVGCVDYEEGLWIRNRENSINVSAHVSIESVISTGTHYNVVGKITGDVNPEKCVIISSHYDTVTCNGFCDNGAGAAGVIELAKVLADAIRNGFYKPRYTLLFVSFTSEEFYLVGSINYVKSHKSEMPNIVAVINLDCIGSDEIYVTETNPVGELDLDQLILDAAQDLGMTATLEPPTPSDHETFLDPLFANSFYQFLWGLDAGISDATPVESSAMLESSPLFFSDKWDMGTPGWIHTRYDNSTSTQTLNWVETEDLENHIKVATLAIIRVSPNVAPPRHDIAIADVTPSKTVVGRTYSILINVTIDNQGGYTETFNVALYANTTMIGTQTINNMPNETSTILSFAWDTTDFAKGNYTVSAVADQVPDETHTDDNSRTGGWIHITKAGDFGTMAGGYYDFDDLCDYQDLFLFRKSYVEEYKDLCDFDNDRDVDYRDLFQFRQCYINPDP